MMVILKFLMSKVGIYGIIGFLLFCGGGMSFYYLKYRPLRNEAITAKAEVIILKRQVDVVWAKYVELAKLPRYNIDQHLDRIKVKRGSKLDFTPSAYMGIVDSIRGLLPGDSIKMSLSDTVIDRSWGGRQLDKVKNWFK